MTEQNDATFPDSVEAAPVEQATFASETDPAHLAVPHDIPESVLNPEPDAEAAFVDPANYSTHVAGGINLDANSDDSVADESDTTGVANLGDWNDPEWNASTATDNPPGTASMAVADMSDALILREVYKMLSDLTRELNSIKALTEEVFPVLELLVAEAKEKGLTGLIPLIMQLRK